MNREHVIATLRAHEPRLLRLGVQHASLFGSVARGDVTAASDIDIMIELEPDAPVGMFKYVGITQFLADMFPDRVDVANYRSLKALVRPSAERDAIYAFCLSGFRTFGYSRQCPPRAGVHDGINA